MRMGMICGGRRRGIRSFRFFAHPIYLGNNSDPSVNFLKGKTMQKLLQLRREALKRLRWLRPALLVVDVIFLGIGFAFPDFGLALGVLGVFLNHLFSPIAARIFIKELDAKLRVSGSLEMKVIRKQSDNTQT